MRTYDLACALTLLVACGGAAEPPVTATAPTPTTVVARGAADGGAPRPNGLRELTLRVAPNQSLAYRVRTKTEQPGRKVETESIVYFDAWADGTVIAVTKTGDFERTLSASDAHDLLPIPEGVQSVTEKTTTKPAFRTTEIRERIERQPASGEDERIDVRVERKSAYFEETAEGSGRFDVGAMRYVELHTTRTRHSSPKRPGGKPLPPMKGEMRTDTDIAFDAAETATRNQERSARRERMLRAANEPAGTASPMAEIGAALSGQNTDGDVLEFYGHGQPALVWRAVLSLPKVNPQMTRGVGVNERVPDEVVADVHKAIQKSPSHPVAWLLLGVRDARFLPDLARIQKAHEDPEVRELADSRIKEQKNSSTPLATRLKAQKGGRLDRSLLFGEIDPDRDRAALFEAALKDMATAPEDEREMLGNALGELAKVHLGADLDAWQKFWATHRDKPYDAWLLEALSDPSPEVRTDALRAIRERPPSEALRAAAKRAFAEDKVDAVRLEAAFALAHYKDDAAVRPLLRAIMTEDTQKWTALLSLSFFSDSIFGLTFDYGASKEDHDAALGRWLGWARRRGVDVGLL